MSSLIAKVEEEDFCEVFSVKDIEALSDSQKGELLGKLITFLELGKNKNSKLSELKPTIEKACGVAQLILDQAKTKLPPKLERIQKLLTEGSYQVYYDTDYPIYSSLKLLQESFEDWEEWDEVTLEISRKEKPESKESPLLRPRSAQVSISATQPAPVKSVVPAPEKLTASVQKPTAIPPQTTSARSSISETLAPAVQKAVMPTFQLSATTPTSASMEKETKTQAAERPSMMRVVSPPTPLSSTAASQGITPLSKQALKPHYLSLEASSPSKVGVDVKEEVPTPFNREMLVTRLAQLIDNVFRLYFSNVSLKESPEFGIAWAIRYAQKKLTRIICSEDINVITAFNRQLRAGILCALSTLPMLIEVYAQALNDEKLTQMEKPKDRHLHLVYIMAPKIASQQIILNDKTFIQELAGSWDLLREKYGIRIAQALATIYCEILNKRKLSDSEESLFETLHLGIAQGVKLCLSPQVFISILHRILFKEMESPNLKVDDLELISKPDQSKTHPVEKQLDDLLTKIFKTLMKNVGLGFFSRSVIKPFITSSIATLGCRIQDSWKVTPDREKQIKTVDRLSRLLLFKQEPAFKEYLDKKPEEVQFDKRMQEKVAQVLRKLDSPISLDSYIEKINKQLSELLSCPILLEFFGLVMLRSFADHFARSSI